MPDSFGAVFNTKAFTKSLHDLNKRTERATMWGLREVGRQMKRAARNRAPVYSGDDPRAEKGRLKRSISSSKRLKTPAPGTFSLTLGPRGEVVHRYAGKIEATTRFMSEAYNEILPAIPSIFERAWNKTMQRKG